MAPKKLEKKLRKEEKVKKVFSSEKWPRILWKGYVRGALGGSERIMGISIISYGKNSLDLRPIWVTTSPREELSS
jgi:hypothetical protein